MPTYRATDADVEHTEHLLAAHRELGHLRVRRWGALVTLESGPRDDPVAHIRFRRVAAGMWTLEMANHRGRWEPTGIHAATIDDLLAMVLRDFPWTLAPAWPQDEP